MVPDLIHGSSAYFSLPVIAHDAVWGNKLRRVLTDDFGILRPSPSGYSEVIDDLRRGSSKATTDSPSVPLETVREVFEGSLEFGAGDCSQLNSADLRELEIVDDLEWGGERPISLMSSTGPGDMTEMDGKSLISPWYHYQRYRLNPASSTQSFFKKYLTRSRLASNGSPRVPSSRLRSSTSPTLPLGSSSLPELPLLLRFPSSRACLSRPRSRPFTSASA